MGKIMLNGKQYGIGGITDADDIKYTDSQTVKGALDEVKNGLINSTTYSTSETVIGKWIDGRPIYRNVYTSLNYGDATQSWTNTGATIANFRQLVSIQGIAGSNLVPFMGFRVLNNAIQYWASTSWGGTDKIVVEYTKTTD